MIMLKYGIRNPILWLNTYLYNISQFTVVFTYNNYNRPLLHTNFDIHQWHTNLFP